jgi:hypothetical protein
MSLSATAAGFVPSVTVPWINALVRSAAVPEGYTLHIRSRLATKVIEAKVRQTIFSARIQSESYGEPPMNASNCSRRHVHCP